jgi:hypothetical protein
MVQIKNHFKSENPAKSGIFNWHMLLVLLGMFSANASFAQALAKTKTNKFDFGTVVKGEVLEFNYTVFNIGKSPLLIQPYEPDCSCTSVILSEKPVLPGDSTVIKIKFNTGIVYERQDRVVKLNSNGGSIKLRFKGFVKKNN